MGRKSAPLQQPLETGVPGDQRLLFPMHLYMAFALLQCIGCTNPHIYLEISVRISAFLAMTTGLEVFLDARDRRIRMPPTARQAKNILVHISLIRLPALSFDYTTRS
jgi:hypothetical protein